MTATASAGAAKNDPARRSGQRRPRETVMITSNSRSAGIRFAIAIVLSAVIAGGYLSAIGYLSPGFIA